MMILYSLASYLQPAQDGAGTTLINTLMDICGTSVNNLDVNPTGGFLAILKMPADATQDEIVYDQRI